MDKAISITQLDKMGELLCKSEGVVRLLQTAGEAGARLEPEELAATAWVLHGMLQEARGVLREIELVVTP